MDNLDDIMYLYEKQTDKVYYLRIILNQIHVLFLQLAKEKDVNTKAMILKKYNKIRNDYIEWERKNDQEYIKYLQEIKG